MNRIPQLTIRTIRVRGLNLQLAGPIETASGVMNTASLVLVDLVTNEGILGCSYLRCYTPLVLQPLVQLVATCGEMLSGQIVAPITIGQKFQQQFRLLSIQGLLGMALAGIDMALWDALASGSAQEIYSMLKAGSELALRLLSFPTPVVVACNGDAYPMGAFLILAVDLRLVAQGCKF